MTSFELFGLKNRMLFYNLFTNLIGVWIVILLSFRAISPPFYEIADIAHRIDLACIPSCFFFIVITQIIYKRPIRACLNTVLAGGIDQMVADVNRQLTADIQGSGQFMALFFLHVDVAGRAIEWVRAGHDPALLCDPGGNDFIELNGNGIPLGIEEHYPYPVNRRKGLAAGQVIVLGTDGVWEARNREGRIFGKQRFYPLVREHAHRDAAAIAGAVVEEVRAFQGDMRAEDDITLVVVKIEAGF